MRQIVNSSTVELRKTFVVPSYTILDSFGHVVRPHLMYVADRPNIEKKKKKQL